MILTVCAYANKSHVTTSKSHVTTNKSHVIANKSLLTTNKSHVTTNKSHVTTKLRCMTICTTYMYAYTKENEKKFHKKSYFLILKGFLKKITFCPGIHFNTCFSVCRTF